MKQYLLINLLMLFFIINLEAQQPPTIPNGNFEQWTDDYSPVGWTTTNINLGFVTYNTVSKSTDKYEGNYAIQLKTISVPMVGNLPGAASNGIIDLMTGQILGGTPTGGIKPQKFKFYFKYTPVNNDTMGVLLLLTRWNGTERDTVGFAGFMTNQAQPTYTEYSQDIHYDLQLTPDTFLIVLVSSAGYVPQENSTLLVDAMSFEGVLQEVIPIWGLTQKVFPNPTNGEFYVVLNENKNSKVTVFNLIGEKIMEKYVNGTILVDISNKPNGIYFVKIENDKESKTIKLIKE